ncbi:MAG: thioredoxin family protein [Bacteroidetes bacterium]|nr:thioredoxin family protein [Bacteroidota bacterium]
MKRIVVLFVILLCAYSSNAQTPKVNINAQPEKIEVEKDEHFNIRIQIKLPSPWYAYDIKEQTGADGIGPNTTIISFVPEGWLDIAGEIKSSKPLKKYDKEFEMDVTYFKKSFELNVPVRAKKKINFAVDKLEAVLDMQLCDSARCLPPEYYKGIISSTAYTTAEAETIPDTDLLEEPSLEITEDLVIPTPTTMQKTEAQEEIDKKKEEGFLSFLWFAMIAGALSLLTPCVFPMIPITVSFFTKRAEKKKTNPLKDASVYAIGIMLTFTGLGFLISLIFSATGIQSFASSGWVNLFIATIFIVFAFNLFGAFEIQLPSGLMNKLNKKSSDGTGIISVIFMALTFSIASFTCTVPFVGSALLAASDGEWFYPIIGMLGFSGVLAAPFFLLALFPTAMKKMPKSGGWMNNVKVVMGFILIAVSLKFFSTADLTWSWGILPKELFLAIWVAICLLIVLYTLGVFRLQHDSKVEGLTATRVIWSIIFATLGFYFLTGMFGKSLGGTFDAFVPPAEYREMMGGAISQPTNTSNTENKLNWLNNYDEGLQIAKETGKPLFVDFTGFACTNCKWMEQNMFKKAEISSLLNEFVLVKLYTDRRDEPYFSNKRLQEEKYGSVALPLYVILSADADFIGTKAFTRDINEFATFLNKGIESKK